MPKRLEIIVRNPGFENTENALGAYTIDFGDPEFLNRAVAELNARLRETTRMERRLVVTFLNEKGVERGLDLQYYVSHQITDVDDWEPPPWRLPGDGESPPNRED